MSRQIKDVVERIKDDTSLWKALELGGRLCVLDISGAERRLLGEEKEIRKQGQMLFEKLKKAQGKLSERYEAEFPMFK